MERLTPLFGSQLARSPIANAQRCINYYPEWNAKDSPVPVTHYQRPGLRPLVQWTNPAPVRGVFRASNGQGYCVIGQDVLAVSSAWGLTQIGRLGADYTTPCSLTDNGIEALLVDSSDKGYTWDLATNTYSQFVDPTGLFGGATAVANIDGFIVWNMPGTHQFGSTLNFTLAIDPTYAAGKVNYPDLLQTLVVNHHELMLIGQVTSETWYDAGNVGFPFAELPGADHEHGTPAPYSVAFADISVFWLGQNRQGQGVVMRARGYEAKRISNHPLEVDIRRIKQSVGITDAVGYTVQQDGHLFYVLNFPLGNKTWVFDEATEEWHQWAWLDPLDGTLNRFRGNSFALLYNTNVVGDWENGTLYELDPRQFTDTVNGLSGPIPYIRGFPHLLGGTVSLGAPGLDRPVPWMGQRMMVKKLMLDLECGNGPRDVDGNPAQITLRWSINRGKTFEQEVLQSSGAPGQYETQPQWLALGQARDFVFEIQHQIAGEAALNGAWIDSEVMNS